MRLSEEADHALRAVAELPPLAGEGSVNGVDPEPRRAGAVLVPA